MEVDILNHLNLKQSYITDKLIEEMSELTKALIKYRYTNHNSIQRKNEKFENIIEEIADVEVYLKLIKDLLLINEQSEQAKIDKMYRLVKMTKGWKKVNNWEEIFKQYFNGKTNS